jgi:hypothetical protein
MEGKGKEGSKSRATTLPPDFVLTPEREAYAVSKGADPKAEIEAFRAHHTAHGKTMRDWDAAWRTWCINARKFAGKNLLPGKSTAGMHEDADERRRREAIATARADQRRWKLRPQMLGEDEDSFVSRISREAGDAQLKTFQKPGSAA